MTENKLETLITTIDIRHLKGATILSVNTIEELKKVLSAQTAANGKFPFVEIGQSLLVDGKKYIVKNIRFRIQEFSMETGTTPGANMYAENYSTDTNLNLEVSVDNEA